MKCTLLVYICFFSKALSQSIQELQSLREQYERSSQRDIQTSEEAQISDDINLGAPERAILTPYILNTDSLLRPTYFGYDFFTKRDSVIFWENLPAPSSYVLGPGDELIVSMWGQTQLRNNYVISKDGKIYDEKVGLMVLSGKTLTDAYSYFNKQYQKAYSTLSGNNPKTFMDVSLGQLGAINVNFVGECNFPGVYALHPFSTLITGLIQSGGVDTTGSLRSISIKRNGKKLKDIDLYEYFLKGKPPEDIQLRDQDVVYIPPRISSISIEASVKRPGIYEALEGETVYDMINYAGGLKSKSSNYIGIKRIDPFTSSNQIHQRKSYNYYINFLNSKDHDVFDGDLITIEPIFETINEVESIGKLKRPGKYYFYDGMKVKNLLELSGGINDTTFSKSMYDGIQLVRRKTDSKYEEIINLSIEKIKEDDKYHNIPLQNLDRVLVQENSNFSLKKNVRITGEVSIPGSYPIMSDGETLGSIINRAGKMTTKALQNGIEIYRQSKYFYGGIGQSIEQIQFVNSTDFVESSNNQEDESEMIRVAWQNFDVKLMPGDSIIVKEATRSVNISGEVYNPGLIEFQKNKSLRFYINSAGGLTPRGNNKDIIVVYANGVIVPNRWFNSPKILDGSTIIVNQKQIQEPFDVTQFATNWTSIISSLITAVVLSRQL